MEPDDPPHEPPREQEPPPEPVVPPIVPHAGDAAERLRLQVRIPSLVKRALEAMGKSPETVVNEFIGNLWRKYTPERGPSAKSTYAGEVRFFERLLEVAPETRTVSEQLFVTAQEAWEALDKLATREGATEQARREARLAADALLERIHDIQELVRRERGEDAPQADWEATQP